MNHDLMVLIVSLMNIPVKDRLMQVFFDRRKTSAPVYALSFMYYILFINLSSLLRIQNGSIIIWFTAYIVLSLNYEGTWKRRVASSVILVCIGVLVDLVITMTFGIYYTTFSGENLMHNNLSMVLFALSGFLVAALLSKFKNIRKNINVPFSQWGIAAGLPAASVMLMFILMANADIPALPAFMIGLIIFGATVTVLYLHDNLTAAHEKNLIAKLHKQEKEYYLTQCQLMKESTDKVRAIRHDMKMHLVTIAGLANNPEDISAYVNSLFGDIEASEIYSQTGNLAFDSIINYKLKDTKNSGIKTGISLKIPPTLNIDDADIVTIMGNLIDNALEAIAKAVAKTEDKILNINVLLDNGALLIKTENSFSGKITHSPQNEILSSKCGDEYGHGLKNIKRSVDKYDGYVKISHTDNIFSVRILIALEA